jgi:FkbM family methyltransferase
MYSQKNEDTHIIGYFESLYGKDYEGTLLDIGANDGVTLSNSFELINRGWGGDLVEPAALPARRLKVLYKNQPEIKIHEVALDTKVDRVKFYESSSFLSKNDSGLLSTIVPEEKKRWWLFRVRFTEYEIDTIDFKTFSQQALYAKWDFISIDAEGKDWDILQQIDLTKVECQCLCVEHNGVDTQKYIDYGKKHGLSVLLINNINVVMTRKYDPKR